MPGIRLHHTGGLRNCTVAVECFRAYIGPYECPLCLSTHHHKTVHLHLDNEGDVIVSKGVWNKDLKDHPNLPFEYDADVKKPPALIIGGPEVERTIHHHEFQGRR